jgi:hypothetical protein
MHTGSDTLRSKSEAMYFLPTLKEAKLESLYTTTLEDPLSPNNVCINFTRAFKYLGSIITPELNEDAKI